ncbi:MAG: hypothetical protein JWR14_3223 [Caballeronia sp.]|jgi:spore coat protein U-like protein|uniref:hypothetical protein n=1 Tax=Caballeronia sp. TaxID=1931223 RepID=UPI0026038755|nr:hypothetical protein [Caballeronia sp.]MDB5833393.1 hypothetical protein [Caballeronia sp.]
MLRKNKTLTLAAIVLGACASDVSPTELATLSVNLIVQESCVIQSAADLAVAVKPSVSCLHGQPYDIALTALDPALPVSTVQYADRSGKQSTVWMVGF